jgi:hypothetical protein
MSDVISRVRSFIGTESREEEATTTRATSFTVEPEPKTQLDLDIDEALDVLSNERRRLAIRFIHAQGSGEFDLNEVVRYITTEECGLDFDSMERKRVYVSLYQTHIEQLIEADVIQPVSDGEAHQYRPDVAAEPLFDLLTTAEEVLEVSD